MTREDHPGVNSHPPMDVSRVQDASGSHIEPALDQRWSELDQLRWKAGVVAADAGIRVEIQTNVLRRNGRVVPGRYGIAYMGGGGYACDFECMWSLLNGIELGAKLAKRTREAV